MIPSWLITARGYIGLREIPGAPTQPVISTWLRKLKAWWGDDETPWCGTFVAACLQDSAIALPKHWYRAKGWLDWGMPLTGPAVGCVVIFQRDGGGHAGFVVGRTTRGQLLVVGGNQANSVSEAPFAWDRVIGYRWPSPAPFEPLVGVASLPVFASIAGVSRNEA